MVVYRCLGVGVSGGEVSVAVEREGGMEGIEFLREGGSNGEGGGRRKKKRGEERMPLFFFPG